MNTLIHTPGDVREVITHAQKSGEIDEFVLNSVFDRMRGEGLDVFYTLETHPDSESLKKLVDQMKFWIQKEFGIPVTELDTPVFIFARGQRKKEFSRNESGFVVPANGLITIVESPYSPNSTEHTVRHELIHFYQKRLTSFDHRLVGERNPWGIVGRKFGLYQRSKEGQKTFSATNEALTEMMTIDSYGEIQGPEPERVDYVYPVVIFDMIIQRIAQKSKYSAYELRKALYRANMSGDTASLRAFFRKIGLEGAKALTHLQVHGDYSSKSEYMSALKELCEKLGLSFDKVQQRVDLVNRSYVQGKGSPDWFLP